MVCSLVLIYFDSPQLGFNKNKLLKTLTIDPDILNFNFPEKGLGLVSPSLFVYDF